MHEYKINCEKVLYVVIDDTSNFGKVFPIFSSQYIDSIDNSNNTKNVND
jgi:hypothetical protein